MQFPEEIINQLSPATIKVVAVLSVSLLFSAAGYLLKSSSKRSKQEAEQTQAKLDALNRKVDKMGTNCLPTIQANTGKTAELLERLVETQAEFIGYMKGKME